MFGSGLRIIGSALLWVFLCINLPGVVFADETYDLESLYELALARSPQLKASAYSVEFAEARLNEAKYYWAPKFELTTQFAPIPKLDLHDTDEKMYKGIDGWGVYFRNRLEMTLPIFTSFKVWNTRELAAIGLDVEKMRVDEVRFRVKFDIAKAYYGLQLARAGADVVSEAQGYIDRVQREYDKLLDSGADSVKKTDQYRIDLSAAQLEQIRNELESGRIYAEQGLTVHTMLESPIAVAVMDFESDVRELKSYEDILVEARGKRPDLQLLELGEAAALKQARIEWLNWFPDLAIGAELRFARSNAVPKFESKTIYDSDNYNHFGFGAVLVLRWRLDPVRQVFKVKQANAEASRVGQMRKLAVRGIELEVRKQYLEVVNLAKRVEVVYQARRSAKRFLTQELLDYESGDGKVQDLISALSSYIEQRSLYLYSLHDYRLALVKLEMVTGSSDLFL